MPKFVKIILKVFGWTLASLAVILAASIAVLNTSFNKKVADALVPKFIDGAVSYSSLRFHLLPEITLSIDSLTVTGPSQDTIATADGIRAGVKTLPLLKKKIRVTGVDVNSLSANLIKDENGRANWDIVKSSPDPDTTEKADEPYSPLDLIIGHLHIDGAVAYSTPSYSVLALLDTINLSANDKASYDVVIDTEIDYRTASTGTLTIPFKSRGRLDYALDSASTSFFIDSLKTSLAYIPLMLDGTVVRRDWGYGLDLTAGVKNYGFKPVLDKYLAMYSPDIVEKVTAGTISINAKVKGNYSDTEWPDVDASLKASVLGSDISIKGRASNLTADRPVLGAQATILAPLDSFMRFVPDSMDVNLSGNLDLRLDKPYSSDQRFTLTADIDTLAFKSGKTLAAAIRNMHNTVDVTYEENYFGKMVPKLEVTTSNDRVRLLMNGNRMNFKDVALKGSIRKIKIDSAAVAEKIASMPRRTKRDSIPGRTRNRDFEKNDISVTLDSTITRFLSNFSPAGSVHIASGMIVSPQFPLRVRITGLDGKFDSNKLDIDYAGIQAGRSDLAVSGDLSGYGRTLRGGKGYYTLNLDAYSRRCNVNELMAAAAKGKKSDFVETGDAQDESFAVDSISDAPVKEPMPLIVIPANLKANININADKLHVMDMDVTPLEASFRVRNSTAQLLSSKLATSIGELSMDAYYSTRSKQDISAGLHVDASKILASGIIGLVPSVDTLLPMLKSFEGNMNAALTATTQLDTNMNVILPTLNAMFRIYGKDLCVNDVGNLRRITRLLLFRNPDIGRIDDMSVGGVVRDSQLEIYPFILSLDRYRFALSGTQAFEGPFSYHASILRSPILIRFGINIDGSPEKWKWRLCRAKYKSSYAPVYSQRIDSMQFNLAQSIRGVFSHGTDNIQRAIAAHANAISKDCRVDDSLQLKLAIDPEAPDTISEEDLQSSFNEQSQQRISSLREKIEQRAITRRAEVIERKEQKKK